MSSKRFYHVLIIHLILHNSAYNESRITGVLRRRFIYTCGRFPFTLNPDTTPPAELFYQLCEFQQIRHAEKRTIPAYDDLRIRSNEIRPLRRNRADGDIIDPEQETSSITVVSLAHASDLPAAERMKRMRDAHKTHRWDRITCILN